MIPIQFLKHILKVRKKYFCATCTGLLIGAIMGIIGSFVYFFGDFEIEGISILVPLGMICVFLGYSNH